MGDGGNQVAFAQKPRCLTHRKTLLGLQPAITPNFSPKRILEAAFKWPL